MKFCDNTIREGDVKIRIVQGNLLRLAIRLTRRTLEKVDDEIEATDEDFIPSSNYPVTVELSKGREKLTFNATMREGSLACIEDKGTIPEGTYCVAVRCKDDYGNPYRFKQRTVVRVYDVTADAGIVAPIEYEVGTWYLDAAIFLALSGEDGHDGRGIDDILTEESDENGGYNTVTFVLSDGSTRWFRVRNGGFDIDTVFSTTSTKPLANATITARFNELNAALAGLFAGVAYNSTAKRINFFGRDNTLIAWIDATPFVKDNELTNVYISNGQLIIVTTSRTFSLPLSSIFNPNLYYTRSHVDNLLNAYYTKAQVNERIQFIYNDIFNMKPLFVPVVKNGNTYSSTVDFGQIRNAVVEDNRIVVAVVNGVFYHLFGESSDYVAFSIVSFEEMIQTLLIVNSDNEWWVDEYDGGSGGSADLSNYYTQAQTNNLLAGKVDKEQGKGLSTNDYTTAEKDKLAGLSAQVQSDWEESDTSSPAYIQHKPTIPTAINGKSAYQIALDNGFEGSEADWLASLHGQNGQDGQDGQDGANGVNGQDGQNGADGKSAYQSYLDTTTDNPKKTEAAWVASLKGEQGNNGFSVEETSTAIVFTVWQGATIEETSTKITITA